MTKLLGAVLLILAPTLLVAGPAHFYDQPDTTYATNVVIDIIEHAGGIWFATGEGINFSFDDGETWLLYNTGNGLVGNDVSAMYSGGGRLWIATNHIGIVAGGEEVFSDGMSYTDDNGQNWVTPDWDDSTLYPKYITGPYRTIYDIAGAADFQERDWVFATAFAGAVLASNDNGLTWRRLFATRDDSLNFVDSYNGLDTLWWRNRAFSVVADTSHGDSLHVWVGTAGGILQYVFLAPRDKFSAQSIQKVELCRSCSSSGEVYAWFGGVNGVSGGKTTGGQFWTRFPDDFGLLNGRTTAIQEFGEAVFVGMADSVSGTSRGLFRSTDRGLTYSAVNLDSVAGDNRTVQDLAVVRERLYMAGDEAGLWVSQDTGTTWERIYLDSASTGLSNTRNITHSVEALGDTLFVGTDSGLSVVFLDPTGSIDSTRHYLPSLVSSSRGIHQIRLQLFTDTVSLVNDSFAVWTINRPVGANGVPTVSVSFDRGLTWSYYRVGGETYDVGIVNVPKDLIKNVYFVSPNGVQVVSMGLNPAQVLPAIIADAIDTTILVSTDTVFSVATKGDTLIFGGKRGAAISLNRGATYRVYGYRIDALKPDITIAYTVNSTINVDETGATAGLIGNFIPALGIRYITPDSAWIIASCRPTTSGGNGVSIGQPVPVIDTLTNDTVAYKYRWDVVYLKNFAWNIESFGDTLLLATDDGLVLGWDFDKPPYSDKQFDTLAFRNADGKDLILPGTPAYAARVASNAVWVGTDDGTIRINVDDLADQRLFIRTDPSEEVYAFPVPFSPNRNEPVRFHFEVPSNGNVTLEIFDFAMNLVATPLNAIYYDAGIYPPGPSGDQRPYWDGRNDRGDVVAVGMYYFKLTYPNGEYRWGKIAVVP